MTFVAVVHSSCRTCSTSAWRKTADPQIRPIDLRCNKSARYDRHVRTILVRNVIAHLGTITGGVNSANVHFTVSAFQVVLSSTKRRSRLENKLLSTDVVIICKSVAWNREYIR
jgi:hypothetical protein